MEVNEQDSTQSGTVESSEDQFTTVSMNKTLFSAKLLRSMICGVNAFVSEQWPGNQRRVHSANVNAIARVTILILRNSE